MRSFSYGTRLVRLDADDDVTWVGPPGSGRGCQPMPKRLRERLRPQGWEGGALAALAKDRRGDPNAVVAWIASLSVRTPA